MHSEPIDLVYCWAGETSDGCSSADLKWGEQKNPHDLGCDMGELRYSLRSVARYAPWVNKIHILVNGRNGTAALPSFVKKGSTMIEMVDRCALFDDPGHCPTFNSFACDAVVHRVPGLSKRFLYMEDDYLFTNSATKDVFFTASGLPRIFAKNYLARREVYGGAKPLPNARMPQQLERSYHVPVPLDRDFLQTVESSYPEWFDFVRSHKHRYCCCDEQKAGRDSKNCLDEDVTAVWMSEMLDAGVGVLDSSVSDPFCELDEGAEVPEDGLRCLESKLNDPSGHFINMNNMVDRRVAPLVLPILNLKLGQPAAFEISHV